MSSTWRARKGNWLESGATGSQELKDYKDFDVESRKRALGFIKKNAEVKKPFYVAWWPLFTSFIPNPKKVTLQRGLVGEEYQRIIEPDIEQLRATLD